MKLRGMTVYNLRHIVKSVSEDKYGANLVCEAGDLGTQRRPGTNFVLRVKSSKGPGARRSSSGRRTIAACWHAHRDVMVDVFTMAPDARLTSALADYRGQEDFLASFPYTAHHNVGSMIEPAEIGSLCECNGNGLEGVLWARHTRVIPVEVQHEVRDYVSGDAMVWDPKESDDEIAEWAKILREKKR